MGKTKELFMKIHYPQGDWDIEREWRINDSLKEEQEYLEYESLKRDPDVNIDHAKIEVHDGETSRIEISDMERETYSPETKIFGDGFQ